MNKTLFVLATLALFTFAQDHEIGVEALGSQHLDADGGEVVTETVNLEVKTVIPPQPTPEAETIIHLGEIVHVEQTLPIVQEVTTVEENINVQETIVLKGEQPNVEDVTIVEENVITQPGKAGETIVNIGEVTHVQQELPNVEGVTIVEENVVVEEHLTVQTTTPPVEHVTIVEEHIIVEEGAPGETIVVVQEVNTVNQNEGWNYENVNLGGDVEGSASANIHVTGWHFTGGKMIALPMMLISAMVGLVILS